MNGEVWSCFHEKLSCATTTIFILFSTHMLLPSLGQPRSSCSPVGNRIGKFLVCTNHYPKKEEGWELTLFWVRSSLVFIETWAGKGLEAGSWGWEEGWASPCSDRSGQICLQSSRVDVSGKQQHLNNCQNCWQSYPSYCNPVCHTESSPICYRDQYTNVMKCFISLN